MLAILLSALAAGFGILASYKNFFHVPALAAFALFIIAFSEFIEGRGRKNETKYTDDNRLVHACFG